jgi:hypothetical protein
VKQLRKPALVITLVLAILVVMLELGTFFLPVGVSGGTPALPTAVRERYKKITGTELKDNYSELIPQHDPPPGMAIRYLALLDSIVLFSIGLIVVSLLVPPAIHAKYQGVVTLVFNVLLVLGAIVLIFVAIAAIVLMIALLLAFPFGTIVYFIKFASFDRDGAGVILSFLMTLKLGIAISLVVAHQDFLKNINLLLLIITSLIANLIVSFLHRIVPQFLASITDGVAAVIVAILAIIWAIALIIGSIFSIILAIKPQPC